MIKFIVKIHGAEMKRCLPLNSFKQFKDEMEDEKKKKEKKKKKKKKEK